MASTLAFAESPAAVGAYPLSASRRVTLGAALLATACVLGLVEASLPPLALVPWLRVGLANIAVVVALVTCGPLVAVAVSLGRVFIVGLATGTLASPVSVMALAGAIAALAVMVVLARRVPDLSSVGLSAAGSAAHVAAQFAAAALMLQASSILVLAPPSVLVALVLGAATGALAGLVVSRIVLR
jgi:heptaprenyl diphosphate synthase